MPNMTSDDDRMAIRKNWDMLMPCKPLEFQETSDYLTDQQWEVAASEFQITNSTQCLDCPSKPIQSEQAQSSKLLGHTHSTVYVPSQI